MRILVFAAILAIASPTFAKNTYINCVQRQLTASGHDPGPIDGALGPQTRRALAAFTSKNDGYSHLPKLSLRSGVTWCRTLAEENAALRQYRPAAEGILWRFGPKITAEDRPFFRKAFASAAKFFKDTFDFEGASRIEIVVATTTDAAFKELVELKKRSNRRARLSKKEVKRRCNPSKEYPLFAYASRDAIVVCLTEEALEWLKSPNGRYARFLERVMVHEFTHMVQRELVADKVEIPRRRDARSLMGPGWMVEGVAKVMEREFELQNRRNPPLFKRYEAARNAEKTKLRNLSKSWGPSAKDEYAVSFWASELLNRRYGKDALLAYFDAVGAGNSWESAFQLIFGMTLQEWDRTFEKLRGDYGRAISWGEGKDQDPE
ncbi:MAG: peptidoglycan-binding domain-containing protein [Pseudomonadota bacterium]